MQDIAQGGLLPHHGITPALGKKVYRAPGSWVIGDVQIGDNSSIWFNTVLRGDVHHIRVGRDTNIQDNTLIHVSTGISGTYIGDRVTIGHSVVLHACTIEDEVLVGMGAIILDEAVVPKHCFVAAGSLISPRKTYPPGSMLVGRPAVVKRALSTQEIDNIIHSAAHYCRLAASYMGGPWDSAEPARPR